MPSMSRDRGEADTTSGDGRSRPMYFVLRSIIEFSLFRILGCRQGVPHFVAPTGLGFSGLDLAGSSFAAAAASGLRLAMYSYMRNRFSTSFWASFHSRSASSGLLLVSIL